MRRMAFGFAFLWLALAFCVRLYDLRKPQVYLSALTGGQKGMVATVAGLQGTLPWKIGPDKAHGRLVVVDASIEGKILRYASLSLPKDWLDCRLWLEEGPDVLQAVANCPGHGAHKLTASGQSLLGLGPDNRPGALDRVAPLTWVEPERIVSQVHRREAAPSHPLLLILGLLAMAPLGLGAYRSYEQVRRLRGKPVLEGVMEETDKGSLTIRSGERRVTVFVEEGEVLSIGLHGAAKAGDAMAVEGLRAAIQGQVEHQQDAAFRGGETMRLRKGAILVVGDLLSEARHRLLGTVAIDVVLAGIGVVLATVVALGWGF